MHHNLKNQRVMSKCILLVRVSTENEKQEKSMKEQEAELYAFAKQDGYEFEDCIPIKQKESGRKRFFVKDEDAKDLIEIDRQGLIEMKEHINNDSSINAVYAWEISRISRRKKVLFDILEFLTDRKIQLCIKSPAIKLLNENGSINEASEMAFTLFAQIAESEMRNKIARWKRTKDAKRREGTYVGGWVLFGYKVDEVTKKLVVNEEEAEIVKEIYSMYLSGQHSYNTIAKELKERGLFNSLLSGASAVRKILKNTAYAGLPSSDYDKTARTDGNIYPAIISIDMIEKAKSIIEINSKALKKKHNEVFYGKSILRCPHCNAIMRVRKDYLTYTCQNPECTNNNYYQANLIDAMLWYQGLQNYIFNWQNTSEDDVEKLRTQLKKIEKKLIANEQQKKSTIESLDRLEERIILGKISTERATKIEDKLNVDLKECDNIRRQLINEKAAVEVNLKAIENDEILNMNELLKITDNEKRYEIIKDNVEKATIERLNTQISKILIYIKPKFDYKYKDVPQCYYLNTKSSIVYNGNYDIDKFETDVENQECMIKIGDVKIHEHKEKSHKAKEYTKMKNREYQQNHKVERAEYMRKFRAKQKALKNQTEQPEN